MVSLKEVNAEVDEGYGPFVVEDVEGGDVVLRNPLRLTKNEREQLGKLDSALKSAQASSDINAALDAGEQLLKLVSVGDGGERLVNEIGDDPVRLMHIIRLFGEATQVGEASRSES